MLISDQTIEVLKNFSYFNNGLSVDAGNLLRTINTQKNVLVEYKSQENFDTPFSVYDLSTFLAVLSISGKNPNVEFEETMMVIKGLDGRSSTKYRYCDPEHIITAPKKSLEVKNPDVEFTLPYSSYESMLQFANTLSLPDLNFISEGKKIDAVVTDNKNDSSNSNSIHLCEGNGNKFCICFKVINLKFIRGDYDVKISKDGLAQFTNKTVPITYWVTVETKGSSFTKG